MEAKRITEKIVAKILNGVYTGKNVEVTFGKPIKITVDKQDVSKALISLNISLSHRGHVIYLELAELDYSQFKS